VSFNQSVGRRTDKSKPPLIVLVCFLIVFFSGTSVAQAAERWIRPWSERGVTKPPVEHESCSNGPPIHLENISKCNVIPGHIGTINRSVTIYEEGLSFSYYKDSIPLPLVNRFAAEHGDISAIQPLLEKLEPFVGPIDRYSIEIEKMEFPQGDTGQLIISFVQNVAGHKVAGGYVRVSSVAHGRGIEEFTGFLIEPELPQLQPDSWMGLKEAQDLAVDAIRSTVQGGNAESCISDMDRSALKGKVIMDIIRLQDGMEVNPEYRAVECGVKVHVNLYNSIVKAEETRPVF
jgi:hypothetical protein